MSNVFSRCECHEEGQGHQTCTGKRRTSKANGKGRTPEARRKGPLEKGPFETTDANEYELYVNKVVLVWFGRMVLLGVTYRRVVLLHGGWG